LPGWENTVDELYVLRTTITGFFNKYYMFDYTYDVPEDQIDTDNGIYAPFEVMKDRFHQYLEDSDLLNIKINMVGFSEGGIIALYSAGVFKDILTDKYISIASPHHGAYKPDFHWIHDNDSVTKQYEWKSDFMKDNGIYANAASNFFNGRNNNDSLQIYSPKDIVATPDSAKRFESNMDMFEVTEGFKFHNALPTNNSVIKKVVSFLNGNV
jgi:hypothetical protein